MRLSAAWIVWQKELADSLRDRRTWTYSVVLPIVLVPLLMIATSLGVSRQTAALTEPVLEFSVAGAEHGPGLIDYFEASGSVAITLVPDAVAALHDGAARVGLVIPPGFDAAVAAETPAALTVLYDRTDPLAEIARHRLIELLQQYGQSIEVARLQQRGLDPALLRPLQVAVEGVGSVLPGSAGLLILTLPMFLALWGAVGGMHVAIDVTAGEKERGTLEILLTAPVSRLALVAGKYLTVLVSALFAQVVSLAGFVIGFRLKAVWFDDGGVELITLAWPVLGGIMLAALVLAAFFAAVELALSLQARSVREAQSLQAPISFAAMVPWLLVQFLAPADVPAYLFFVPIFNNIVLCKELLMGIVDVQHIAATVITSGLLACAALCWAALKFNDERVLVRS